MASVDLPSAGNFSCCYPEQPARAAKEPSTKAVWHFTVSKKIKATKHSAFYLTISGKAYQVDILYRFFTL
jgi:hypothetical protein